MRKLTPATIDTQLLSKLHAKTADKQAAMWLYTKGHARTFKDEITSQLTTIQNRRCAYCGVLLTGDQLTRDHIAPREHHPEYTFFPANLVLACTTCNTECKGRTDTVAAKNGSYEQCTFIIIHPHFDEPSDHIEFVGGVNRILIKVVQDSQKGRETVRMFRLASPEMSKRRAMDVLAAQDLLDLQHMPGHWRDGFEYVLNSKLGIKFRIE